MAYRGTCTLVAEVALSIVVAVPLLSLLSVMYPFSQFHAPSLFSSRIFMVSIVCCGLDAISVTEVALPVVIGVPLSLSSSPLSSRPLSPPVTRLYGFPSLVIACFGARRSSLSVMVFHLLLWRFS